MPAKKKTDLQKYLEKQLPPFQRGSSDCVAWVGAWVNHQVGGDILLFPRKTFGEVVRSLQAESLESATATKLSALGFKAVKSPKEGDVVIIAHEEAFQGKVVGIFSAGSVIVRTEKDGLFVEKTPNIIAAWNLSQ